MGRGVARPRTPPRSRGPARDLRRAAPRQARGGGAIPEAGAPRGARPAEASARRGACAGDELDRAKAAVRELTRDRQKRRYRHHWERAIAGSSPPRRGATGRPRSSRRRARATRSTAGRPTSRTARRRSSTRRARRSSARRDARPLAAAIRREAGDDRPAPRPARGPGGPPAPAPDARRDAPGLGAGSRARRRARGSHRRGRRAGALARRVGRGGAGRASPRCGPGPTTTTRASPSTCRTGWAGRSSSSRRADGLPRRLALDLRPASLAGRALARPVAGERVDRVRAAQNDADTVRVVLDLPGTDRVQLFGLDDPPRLIVDVGTAAARARTSPRPGPLRSRRARRRPGRARPRRRGRARVVRAHRARARARPARPDPARRRRRGPWRPRPRRDRPATRAREGRDARDGAAAREAAPRRRVRGGAHAQGRPVPRARGADRDREHLGRRPVRLHPRERSPAPEPERRRDLLPQRGGRSVCCAARGARERASTSPTGGRRCRPHPHRPRREGERGRVPHSSRGSSSASSPRASGRAWARCATSA